MCGAKEKAYVLELSDVCVGYRKKALLEDINLKVPGGSYIGIIGPNGSGKTTLLKTMLGTIPPIAGKVTVAEKSSFGYVMQRQHVDNLFPFTVMQVVMMGRFGKIGVFKRPKAFDKEVVKNSLDIVGIQDFNKEYRQLSGGQKQRVLIARALASEPKILILDEPTNDMDIKGEKQIMELIDSIRKDRQLTVIIVSHLLNILLNYASSIAFLHGKELTHLKINDVEKHLPEIFGMGVRLSMVEGRKIVLS